MKVPHPAGDRAGQGGRGRAAGSPLIPTGTSRATPDAGLAESSASTARDVADAAVVAWNAVVESLVPIIGKSSVTVLYRRCLVSVGVDRTWLPAVTAADLPENDWTVLHASVSRQTVTEASETTASLFVAFRDLLGSLIGPSLTEQLLRPVSALPPTGSAEQDTSP